MRKIRLLLLLTFSICAYVMQAQNFGGEIVSNQTFGEGLMVIRAKIVPISGTVSNMFFYNRADEPWNDNRWYEYDWEIRGLYPDRGWSQIRVREEAGGTLRDAPVDVRADVNLGDQLYNYILIRKGDMYVYDIRQNFDINTYDSNNAGAHGGNSVSLLTAGPRIYNTGSGVGDIPTWVQLDFSLGITAFDNGWAGSLPSGSYAGDYVVDYARFYQYSGNNLNNYASWSDEFNNNSLDYGKWFVADWVYSKTQFTSQNVKLENGNLIMRISNEQGFNTTTNPPTSECNLPWNGRNYSVSNTTNNYNSGPINISCVTNACISMDLEGIGPMENADFIDAFYRVDGGTQQAISLNTNSFNSKSVIVCNVSGNNVEIIINARTSQTSEIYNVGNIRIEEGSSVPACPTSVPSNRTHSNVTETTAILNWSNDSNVDFYDVRYKKVSDNNWQNINSINAGNLVVNNLTQGTTYEWQVRARCNNDSSSGYGAGPNFTTLQSTSNNNCVPWSDANYAVSNTTNNYSSGLVDISCASSVCITMDIEGVGPMENADYLNVYYKVNGGSQQAISLNTNSFGHKSISVCGVSGNNVEIIINTKTSQTAEIYNVRNIQIVEDDLNPGNGGDCYTSFNSEDFESGYGIWNDGGGDCFRRNDDGVAAQGSDWHIRLRDNSGAASSMFTDDLSFDSVTDIKIDFMYYPNSMESGEDFMLEYSLNGGSSWEIIQAWAADSEFTNGQYYSESVTVSRNFTNNTQLRFRCDASGNGDQIFVDNAEIFICGTAGLMSETISVSRNQSDDAGSTQIMMDVEEASKVEIRSSKGDMLAQIEVSEELVLYPNPVSDILTVKNVSANGPIQIMSINGQMVKTTYNQQIDISDLENGIYFLRSGESIKRFIKQ